MEDDDCVIPSAFHEMGCFIRMAFDLLSLQTKYAMSHVTNANDIKIMNE